MGWHLVGGENPASKSNDVEILDVLCGCDLPDPISSKPGGTQTLMERSTYHVK